MSDKRGKAIERISKDSADWRARAVELEGDKGRLLRRIRDLEDRGPGTVYARIEALGKWAEEKLGHDPFSSEPFESTIYRKFDKLKRRVEELWAEIETHAWEITPAMAQAKLDQLNAEVALLKTAAEKEFEDVEKLSFANLKLVQERDELKKRVEELESHTQQWEESFKGLGAQAKVWADGLSTAQKERDELRSQMAELKKDSGFIAATIYRDRLARAKAFAHKCQQGYVSNVDEEFRREVEGGGA